MKINQPRAEGAEVVEMAVEGGDALAFLLTRMTNPEFPLPMGVLYRNPSRPTYDAAFTAQVEKAKATQSADLGKLLRGSETWTIK